MIKDSCRDSHGQSCLEKDADQVDTSVWTVQVTHISRLVLEWPEGRGADNASDGETVLASPQSACME